MHTGQCPVDRRPMRSRGAGGFTLIELMITVAIVAILLGLAMPTYERATLGMKLTSYTNSLVGSIHLARSEAINRNAVVTLCASTNGTSCNGGTTWERGWIVMCPSTSGQCDPGGAETLVFQNQPALVSGWKITASTGNAITYQPSGMAGASLLKVCRAAPEPGWQEREINISTTGRPSVTKTETGTCT